LPPSPSARPRGDLTRREFNTIKKWRSQGWPISAIARHLKRSQTTISSYLRGDRVPGPRARRADTFAPFRDYSYRRLGDDPHLNSRKLLAEIAGLGYPGSHQSLCRALRRHRILSICPSCLTPARPGPASAPAGHSQNPAPLPVTAAPVTGETLASYLGRLASANHVTVSDLLVVLPPWFRTKISNHDDRAQHHMLAPAADDSLRCLVTVTGIPATALRRALPAFTSDDSPGPVRAIWACQRCLATRGIKIPVPVHLPSHQQICTRHGLWLPAGNTPQLDLTACPEIIAAQYRACRLLRNCTPQQLIHAQLTAARTIDRRTGRSSQRRQRLRLLKDSTQLAGHASHDETASAAIYPDVIDLARHLLQHGPPAPRRPARGHQP
jgi:hypothetical protein